MFLFVLLCTLVSFVPASNGSNMAPVQLTLPDIEADAGDFVVVPVISTTNIPQLNVFQVQIGFNGHLLSFQDIENAHPNLSNIMFTVSEDNENSVFTLNGYNMQATSLPAGSILFELIFLFCEDMLACAQHESISVVEFIEGDTYLRYYDHENYEFVNYDIVFDNGSVYTNPPLHFVEVFVEGMGAVNLNDSPYVSPLVLPAGSTITLEAFPNADWQFGHWCLNNQHASEDNPWEFSLEQNNAVTGHFSVVELVNVAFYVMDNHHQFLEDAIITFSGIENEAGQYVFHQIEPGTHHYSVECPCYLSVEDSLVVHYSDLEVDVTLNAVTGDANGDGLVNASDILAVLNYFFGNKPPLFCFDNADMNQDQRINCLDAILMAHMFMKGD